MSTSIGLTTLLVVLLTVRGQRANSNLQFQLTEECAEGTVVGGLIDAQVGQTPHFPPSKSPAESYQLLTATHLFDLDSAQGLIKTKARIDREEICPPKSPVIQSSTNPAQTEVPCSVDLQILHMGAAGSEPQVILVKIFILDINDNEPSWQEDVINITVPEHTPPGTRYPLPVALDADCGPENTTSRYFLFDPSSTSNGNEPRFGSTSHKINQLFHLDTEIIDHDDVQPFNNDRWNSAWGIRTCSAPRYRLWLKIVGELDYESQSTLSIIQQKQSLRREADPNDFFSQSYILYLAGVDGSRFMPQTGSVKINIEVKDINDHAPYFLSPEASAVDGAYSRLKVDSPFRRNVVNIDVQENAPYGETIYSPRVMEPDASDRENLVFSFDSSTSPSARAVFRIRSKDGTIFLQKSPDYEAQTSYTLPLIVTDGKHTDTQEVHVQVLNLNDHAPTINVRPVKPPVHAEDAQDRQTTQIYKPVLLEVEEDKQPGVFLATVSVTDEDQPPGGFSVEGDRSSAFQCQLSHESFSLEPLFQGAQSQFKLVTRAVFDREQISEIFVALTCHDSGQPRQTSRVDLKVRILDRNDNKPVFKHHPMIARLKENSPVGVNVYRLEAFDADVDENAELVYSISGDGAEEFKVNPKSGLITTTSIIDREKFTRFNLMATVKDSRGVVNPASKEPVNEASAMLTIEVLDENDCAPEFDQPLYQFMIDEKVKVNTLVGEVKARDNDASAENNKIHFYLKAEIMNQANHDFRVTGDGRILVARETLDRETTNMYHFTVVAADSGKPSLTATAQVQIHLGDINDNAPNWLFPPESNIVVNVTIHEPVGNQVALLRAVDPDLGENGDVTFKILHISSLSGGADSHPTDLGNQTITETTNERGDKDQITLEMFELDPSTGALYIARPLRPSDMGLVKILIEASDLGVPTKKSHRTILFNLMDFQRPKFADLTGNRPNSPHASDGTSFQHQDLVVIVVMVAVAIIISLFLIVAMLFLRCPVCLFRDRRERNYSNVEENASAYPNANLHSGIQQTNSFFPEVFRDSHAVGTLITKDGSITSGEDTWFYQTDRDNIIPSRGSMSGKNLIMVDDDGSVREAGIMHHAPHQRPQFVILAKPEGGGTNSRHNSSRDIELAQLGNPGTIRQFSSSQMRSSQSTSCLSGLSSTQLSTLATSPNDHRGEVDPGDDSFQKKLSWRSRNNPSSEAEHKLRTTKAATIGRVMHERVNSPPRNTFEGPQETICLLPASSSDAREPVQRYNILVSSSRTASPAPTASAVTADHLRYVQIHNTPLHVPTSSRGGKKGAPCVSWRVEPHECRTYSPEMEDRTEKTLGLPGGGSGFVDLTNGYAKLGKDAEANSLVTYDHLVHRYPDSADGGSGSCEFSNTVI